jgi:hypothetical protein
MMMMRLTQRNIERDSWASWWWYISPSIQWYCRFILILSFLCRTFSCSYFLPREKSGWYRGCSSSCDDEVHWRGVLITHSFTSVSLLSLIEKGYDNGCQEWILFFSFHFVSREWSFAPSLQRV